MSGNWPLIRQMAIVATVKFAVKVVPSLVAKVLTFAKNGIQSVFGAANDVEELRVALTKTQDVIRDAENLPPIENKALSDWLERLKNELQNAQNVLDEYEKSELRWRVVDPITNKARRLFGRPQMASRLEEVSKGLQAIEEESHKLSPSETIVIETSKKEEMTTGLQEDMAILNTLGGLGKDSESLDMGEFQKNIMESSKSDDIPDGDTCGGGPLQRPGSSKGMFDQVREEFFVELERKDAIGNSGLNLEQPLREISFMEILLEAGQDNQPTAQLDERGLSEVLENKNQITQESHTIMEPSTSDDIPDGGTCGGGTPQRPGSSQGMFDQVREEFFVELAGKDGIGNSGLNLEQPLREISFMEILLEAGQDNQPTAQLDEMGFSEVLENKNQITQESHHPVVNVNVRVKPLHKQHTLGLLLRKLVTNQAQYAISGGTCRHSDFRGFPLQDTNSPNSCI